MVFCLLVFGFCFSVKSELGLSCGNSEVGHIAGPGLWPRRCVQGHWVLFPFSFSLGRSPRAGRQELRWVTLAWAITFLRCYVTWVFESHALGRNSSSSFWDPQAVVSPLWWLSHHIPSPSHWVLGRNLTLAPHTAGGSGCGWIWGWAWGEDHRHGAEQSWEEDGGGLYEEEGLHLGFRDRRQVYRWRYSEARQPGHRVCSWLTWASCRCSPCERFTPNQSVLTMSSALQPLLVGDFFKTLLLPNYSKPKLSTVSLNLEIIQSWWYSTS